MRLQTLKRAEELTLVSNRMWFMAWQHVIPFQVNEAIHVMSRANWSATQLDICKQANVTAK